MGYTVHELAKLANISVRTLHYYDEIGLLKPSSIAKNGYRHYEEKELIRLQQILFFRELEFSLQEIKHILSRPDFTVTEALREQKKLMRLKQNRLANLIKTIDKTIRTMTNNQKIKEDELYDALRDEDVKQYQEEVRQRWGNTSAYKQSATKVRSMTKKEMDTLKENGKKLTKELADAMDLPIGSVEIQTLVQKHYNGINFFYSCDHEMYKNLAQMYVDDPRFTAYYEKFRPGLAKFLRDAIFYYVKKSKKE